MKDLIKVKRILLTTDFLECSRLAAEYAIARARHPDEFIQKLWRRHTRASFSYGLLARASWPVISVRSRQGKLRDGNELLFNPECLSRHSRGIACALTYEIQTELI